MEKSLIGSLIGVQDLFGRKSLISISPLRNVFFVFLYELFMEFRVVRFIKLIVLVHCEIWYSLTKHVKKHTQFMKRHMGICRIATTARFDRHESLIRFHINFVEAMKRKHFELIANFCRTLRKS